MSIYLVDFENVTSEGLSGVGNLTEADKVILFYSSKANKISMPIHIEMSKSEAQFEYKEVLVGGKNALDYQLSTYLGYLIGQKEDTQYFIVSKDRGYKYLSDFWKQTIGQTQQEVVIEHIDAIKLAKPIKKEVERTETKVPYVEKETEVAGQVAVQEEQKESHQEEKRPELVEILSTEKFRSKNNKKQSFLKNKNNMGVSKPTIVVRDKAFGGEVVALKEEQAVMKQLTPNPEARIKQILGKELTKEQIANVITCFNEAKTKQELYIKMVQVLGQAQGSVIYHKLKRMIPVA